MHAARWVNQLAELGWDIHVFPAHAGALHPDFRNVTTYEVSSHRPAGLHQSVRLKGLWPLSRGAARLSYETRKHFPAWADRAAWLARIIDWIKPDIVHSLEFQKAGYLTLEARGKVKNSFPAWAVSNWGSDIYLFGRLSEHADRVKAILSGCDYYTCECHRDIKLARDLGFKGEVLQTIPIAGGFDINRMRRYRQQGLTSGRRLIVLKGYQHWAGRSLVGLRAIESCAGALGGYKVAVYLADQEEVKIAAELTAQATGLDIEIIPPCSHEEILRLHGRARASIGLSISDGISTSALEAMIMGSFPIQSNTSCINEWLSPGEGGLLVPPNDPEAVAAAIRRAVTDDALVDHAAAINAQVADERLQASVIQPQVVAMYEKVAEQIRSRKGH